MSLQRDITKNFQKDEKLFCKRGMRKNLKHIVLIANDTTVVHDFRKEIIAALIQSGYGVTVIAEILEFKNELEALGCKLVDIRTERHGTSVFQDVKLFYKYYCAIKNCSPDMVLTYNIKPNVYAGMACRLLKTPYMPNITGLGKPVEYPGPMQILTTRLYKIGIADATTVFFQNSENQKFFEDRKLMNAKSKPVLLPGSGVNLQQFSAVSYPQGEQTHFLFIARVMKEKGIDLYLAASKRIREKWPNAVFHICGGCDDEAYQEILKREQEVGNIVYHGLQKDMVLFFQMASCIVHPSYYPEGMSNVLLEAAASARPIIATDRSGCRETVNDGETGFLIPIKDEEALVSALERFMELSWDERREMGLKGRAKMEREFDRKTVVDMYLDEIKQCIGLKKKYEYFNCK